MKHQDTKQANVIRSSTHNPTHFLQNEIINRMMCRNELSSSPPVKTDRYEEHNENRRRYNSVACSVRVRSHVLPGDEHGMYQAYCSICGKSWIDNPKYIGKIFHDFRRSAAYESWKAGSSIEDCKRVTGHKTDSMFRRYADLFSDEEIREQQRAEQGKRREWKKAQAENLITMAKRVAVQ